MESYICIDLAHVKKDFSAMAIMEYKYGIFTILDSHIIKSKTYPEVDIEIKDKTIQWELMYGIGKEVKVNY